MKTKKQKIEDVLSDYDLIETDESCLGNITGAMIEIQRYNFWRGVIACFIVIVIPILIGFVIFCKAIINLYN